MFLVTDDSNTWWKILDRVTRNWVLFSGKSLFQGLLKMGCFECLHYYYLYIVVFELGEVERSELEIALPDVVVLPHTR